MSPDDGDHRGAMLTSVELLDGSVSGGLLLRSGDELVLQLYSDEEVRPGDEIRIPGDRYLTVTDVRHDAVDDFAVTNVVVEGPFLRLLRGHRLGDGWPQAYWRDLAEQCEEHGFARPIVKFSERLGASEDLVECVASLYRKLVDEMNERHDQGEYLHPPDPARHVRYGRDQADDWRTIRDWFELVS